MPIGSRLNVRKATWSLTIRSPRSSRSVWILSASGVILEWLFQKKSKSSCSVTSLLAGIISSTSMSLDWGVDCYSDPKLGNRFEIPDGRRDFYHKDTKNTSDDSRLPT